MGTVYLNDFSDSGKAICAGLLDEGRAMKDPKQEKEKKAPRQTDEEKEEKDSTVVENKPRARSVLVQPRADLMLASELLESLADILV